MKIQLKERYRSIAGLTTEDLPDFAILIGRNGAGKSQLLAALAEGQALIPGIGVDEMELYDMGSFHTRNANQANRNANRFARTTADDFLLSQAGGRPLVEFAANIFKAVNRHIENESGAQARDDLGRNLREEIRRLPDFGVFAVGEPRSLYHEGLFDHVIRPLMPEESRTGRGRASDQPPNRFNNNRAALLSAAMKLNGKLPHELVRDDILRAGHYEGDTLSNTVSEVFTASKVDEFIWAHHQIETERVDFRELIGRYREMYRPPWAVLREILAQMRDLAGDDGLFDFDFSDPDGYEITMGNYEQFAFKSEMTNCTTGTKYELDALSSGEKILMALCLVSFNQYLGRRLPKLLLLDELDAVLHPSMVAALVGTLKTLFVPRGTKVLMTSHSPMTVAALEETDIFRMVRTGDHVGIYRTTKSDAINELSEGLATVDVGLRIASYDEAKVVILTEGHNAKHLKKWAELSFPEDVRVFEGLEQHSNDDQLLAYGRMLAKMDTNTHFIIVWDCDAVQKATTLRRELSEIAKVTPYAFKKRADNTIARRGIENNYDEEILEPYSTTTTLNDGTVLSRGFLNNRKTEFAIHILQNGTAEYFTNFQGLHDIVRGILGDVNKPACPRAHPKPESADGHGWTA